MKSILSHLLASIGIYRLKQINSTKIQELLNLKYRNGFSKNYLSNLYGILSGAFKMAVVPYNLIKINPVMNVSLPKYDKNKDSDDLKIISMEDYDRIDLDAGYITVDQILVYGEHEWIFGTPKTHSSNIKIKIGNTLIDLLKNTNKDKKKML